MILGVGSIALDTTRTPFATARRVLGGSASYFSYSASFFSDVAVVGAVGGDFPGKCWKMLEERGVNLDGVEKRADEKTFFFDSSYSYDMYTRHANITELNVYERFKPKIPSALRSAEYLYLGTAKPQQQASVLEQARCRFSLLDTIEYYIANERGALMKVLRCVDAVVLNDIEARQLCNTPNIMKAAQTLQDWGVGVVIIKKGENGAVLFKDGTVFPAPAFPLDEVVDPTGAGDSFSGGFLGHLARRRGLSDKTLREAMVYGNVMGSFAVEDFSLNGLARITGADIERRFKQFKEMMTI